MDPNETLRLLRAALSEARLDDAAEHAENLATWLRRGGFIPDDRKELPSDPAWPLGLRVDIYRINLRLSYK